VLWRASPWAAKLPSRNEPRGRRTPATPAPPGSARAAAPPFPTPACRQPAYEIVVDEVGRRPHNYRWYYRVFQSAPDLIRSLLPGAEVSTSPLGLDPAEPGHATGGAGAPGAFSASSTAGLTHFLFSTTDPTPPSTSDSDVVARPGELWRKMRRDPWASLFSVARLRYPGPCWNSARQVRPQHGRRGSADPGLSFN